MLDLQRHSDCPIWNEADAVNATMNGKSENGMKYACQAVLQAYCKVFDEEELCDLIVRYLFNYYLLIDCFGTDGGSVFNSVIHNRKYFQFGAVDEFV